MSKHRALYAQAKTEYDAIRDARMKEMDDVKNWFKNYRAPVTKPRGHEYDIPVARGVTAKMNLTQNFTFKLRGHADWLFSDIVTNVSRDDCEREDCFHRAYGTDMSAHCGICYDQINKNASKLTRDKEVQAKLKTICGRCTVPPAADPAAPAPFRNYEPPNPLPHAMSLAAF